MPWNRWYGLKSYVAGSLWIVPLVAVAIELVVKRASEILGAWMLRSGFYDLQSGFMGLSMAGARASLDTIVTANLSFVVFTFGSLLVAIQVAGGQYTPRIIATTLLRDNGIRYSVGLFMFTLLFANRTLSYMGETEVHQFQVFLSMLFGLVSFVVFLFLIDHAAKLLRPVSLVGLIGEHGSGRVVDRRRERFRGNVHQDAEREHGILFHGAFGTECDQRTQTFFVNRAGIAVDAEQGFAGGNEVTDLRHQLDDDAGALRLGNQRPQVHGEQDLRARRIARSCIRGARRSCSP